LVPPGREKFTARGNNFLVALPLILFRLRRAGQSWYLYA
jgi:hypothetical protein